MSEAKTIKGYKGFNPDMTCRSFKYESGKEYETDAAKACNTGFHFCETPFDVWDYYPPCDEHGNLNRFCEVEGGGDMDWESGKTACTRIRIGAELDLQGFIKAGVKFIMDRVKNTTKDTGNRSAATNTGNWSAATNTGDWSAATNTGDWSAATNTGDWSAATNTGNWSAATVEGHGSIAIVTGKGSKARGALGCWLVLTERDADYNIKEVKAFKVDGKAVKPMTWYTLIDGEAVEVKEDGQTQS